jgi:hypothetical protein
MLTMYLNETEYPSIIEEGSKMTPWKNPRTSLAQTSSSVMNSERRQQPVRRRQVELRNRVMGIDCMLADIEVEIQRLRDERIHLRLVREGLTGTLSGGSLHKLAS